MVKHPTFFYSNKDDWSSPTLFYGMVNLEMVRSCIFEKILKIKLLKINGLEIQKH